MKRAKHRAAATAKSARRRRSPDVLVLAAILLLYALFSAFHAILTPIASDTKVNLINAPDEAAHLAYARCLAERGALPGPSGRFGTYEWHQPPLYYSLAAPLLRFGPHAVRGLSIVLGILGLICLYLFARTLLPASPDTALFAAALAAFLPMRQAVYSAANNDALTEFCFTVTLLFCTRCVDQGLKPGSALVLGIALGASLLAKSTAWLLVPVVVTSVALAASRHRPPLRQYAFGLASLGIAAVLVFPWIRHLAATTGELVPLRTFHAEFQGTMKASDFLAGRGFQADLWTGSARAAGPLTRAEYLCTVANWTFRTFFGAYTPPGRAASVGVPFFMPPQFYLLFAIIGVLSVAGWMRIAAQHKRTPWAIPALAVPGILGTVLVMAAFSAFAWVYFQAQGRYLYPALAPMSTATALGLGSVFPPSRRPAVFIGVTLLLVILSAALLVAGVLPAYGQPPVPYPRA